MQDEKEIHMDMGRPPILKVQKIFPEAQLPVKVHKTDSGYDLYVYKFEKIYTGLDEHLIGPEIEKIHLTPFSRILVNTGIKATVGVGYELQIRPRSGLALKRGLTVLNTPGTIDEQYRGMIGVILANMSGVDVPVSKGERIAQMVVAPVTLCWMEQVTELSDTERSSGGFGSTGG